MTGQSRPNRIDRAEFRRGFVTILPLWLGVVPFAVAFALLSRTAGLSPLDTMLLSALVFAGSAQLAFVNLVGEHGGVIAIVLTVLLLNLRHVLYGLSLNRYLPEHTAPPRPVLAAVVTDESYGVSIRQFLDGRGSAGFLFGASCSLGVCYLAGTAAGVAFRGAIPDPDRLGLSFVFPLSFLALLLPLLRIRLDLAVALLAGLLAIGLSRVTSGGVTVLTATVLAAGTATAFRRRSGTVS